MTLVAASPAAVRRFGLLLGVVLLVPQLVLAVLVVKAPLVVGLAGFAMTIGFVRLATSGYQTLRDRTPPVGRGLLALGGAAAAVVGALLLPAVRQAAVAMGDPSYTGAFSPPPVIGLNLLVIATLGLWITGAVLVVGAVVGAVRSRTAA